MRFVSFDGPDAREEEEDLQKVCLHVIGSNGFFPLAAKSMYFSIRKIIHIHIQHFQLGQANGCYVRNFTANYISACILYACILQHNTENTCVHSVRMCVRLQWGKLGMKNGSR